MTLRPTFFPTEAEFRRWLESNHAKADELLVGFWKKNSGKPSVDWPQARDQALCFGWIDGVRKSLSEAAYTVRFTPRRKRSVWSKVNIERFHALKAAGQMTAAGERAFEERRENRSHYSYEKDERQLAPEEIAQFKAATTPASGRDKCRSLDRLGETPARLSKGRAALGHKRQKT